MHLVLYSSVSESQKWPHSRKVFSQVPVCVERNSWPSASSPNFGFACSFSDSHVWPKVEGVLLRDQVYSLSSHFWCLACILLSGFWDSRYIFLCSSLEISALLQQEPCYLPRDYGTIVPLKLCSLTDNLDRANRKCF